MEINNILAAPAVQGISELYEFWKKSHIGRKSVFYNFLATPSPERSEFLESVKNEVKFIGDVASISFSVK